VLEDPTEDPTEQEETEDGDLSSEDEADGAEEDLTDSSGECDRVLASRVIDALITRFLNTCGKEFRQRVMLLCNAAKSDTSVALRMRLKVAQCKEVASCAANPAPVTLSEARGDLRLPKALLFELLVQIVEHAPAELGRMKIPQIQQLSMACVTSEAEAARLCSGNKEPRLVNLKLLLMRCAASSGGFLRPDKLELDCFQPLRAAATLRQSSFIL
jgi:hypothetical protein